MFEGRGDDRGAVRQFGALREVAERVDGDDEDDGDVELARVDGGGLDCSQPASVSNKSNNNNNNNNKTMSVALTKIEFASDV